MVEKTNPMVSVCMITYNHEKFIQEAIEGVLMQETTFDFELIIANDCSTDRTHDVIEELIQSHPKGYLIRYFNHETNLGMMPNAFFALEKCDGKYIANCEGDDYWTDPSKLQKQVDFLEVNKDYIISCHNAIIIDNENNVISPAKLPLSQQRDFMSVELMKITPILTLTAVYRNKLNDLPDILKNSPNGDTAIFSYLGQFGKSKYHHDIKNCVYRVHEGGVWSTKSQSIKHRMQLKTFANLAKYYKINTYKEVSLHFQQRVFYVNTLIINEAKSWTKIRLIFLAIIIYIKKKEYKDSLRLIKIYTKNYINNLLKFI
ncbi:glycosyltransferase family 2 protein [Pedobacter alpinus]|uniref:Glycosyltransferase family 2 protein n=1 Tax=Pedobacter alpinus TaxID=1590643 RepID=A0ABW5TPW2_9SPHI